MINFNAMTIDQKKISLIQWITGLQDEGTINALPDLRKKSVDSLPKEIAELLEISDSESEDELIEHTTSKEILGKK